jgi:hypothetical protein
MKRFVKWFDHHHGCEGAEQDINIYAAENNLSIMNIAPYYFWGVYVLFEENKQNEGEWLDNLYCSVCGYYYDTGEYSNSRNFCPNCGAKMKGGAE